MSTSRKVTSALLLAGVLWPCSGFADSSQARQQLRFGISVAQRGLWSEARFRFEKAIQLDPHYAAAYNNLAVALEQTGDFEGARKAYQKALELKPKSRSIQQNFELFQDADNRRKPKDDETTPPKNAS